MKAQWDDKITELDQFVEFPSPGLPAGERWIRGFLLTGFILVVFVELWFLLQLVSLF